jgi:hypothetical protein
MLELALSFFVIVDIHTVCYVTCTYQEGDMILHDMLGSSSNCLFFSTPEL